MPPKCPPKTIQKRSKKQDEKRTKKTIEKRAQHEKKTCPAVNGKRCIQTLFVYFAFCCLHVVLHYFFSNISLKNVIFHTNFLKSSKNRYFYCSYVALGRSWAAFSCSWAALGRSWAALGRSWAALGPLLERHVNIIEKSMRKRPHLGSQKGAKMEPKSTPKRTKIEDKNRCEKRIDIRPS